MYILLDPNAIYLNTGQWNVDCLCKRLRADLVQRIVAFMLNMMGCGQYHEYERETNSAGLHGDWDVANMSDVPYIHEYEGETNSAGMHGDFRAVHFKRVFLTSGFHIVRCHCIFSGRIYIIYESTHWC